MSVERFHFNLGSFECIAIRDYHTQYPTGVLTTDVPEEQLIQALREHGFPTDSWHVDYNCLFVHTGEQRVLIDAGWGRDAHQNQGKLLEGLQAEGITPEDIDILVITHRDIDHIGGIIDAKDQPVFKNARHIVWRGTWDSWNTFDWANVSPDGVPFDNKARQLLQDRVELVDHETEFAPGFQIIPAIGHRPCHIVLSISSEGEQLIHMADAVVHPILIEYADWSWPLHTLVEQAEAVKLELLERVADQNILVFAAHFPFPGLGRVTRDESGWHWQPLDGR